MLLLLLTCMSRGALDSFYIRPHPAQHFRRILGCRFLGRTFPNQLGVQRIVCLAVLLPTGLVLHPLGGARHLKQRKFFFSAKRPPCRGREA